MDTFIKPIKLAIAVFLLTMLTLIGCGGSSGSSSDNKLDLFVTDDARTGYSGVWVKVFRAALKSSTGASVQVFNSADGVTVNLRALNDGAAKFLLLAPGQVPNGTYTKVEFELDKSVTLVATPSGTVTTADFPASLDATVAGHSILSADLTPNVVVPGTTKIAIDFVLSSWDISGGIITPVLNRHNGNGLGDINRHAHFEFNGVVSGIVGTSPNQTFNLTLKSGGTAKVTTDETTSIIFDANITALSNGLKVEVYGVYDPASNTILAKMIRVESEFGQDDKAIGLASAANVVSETFVMAPAFTRHFFPQGDSITVSTTANTKFRGRHGVHMTKVEFYAAVVLAGVNAVVEAEGTYSEGSNTLVAKSVSLENEAQFGEDEAKGTASLANLVNLTFDLATTEVEGFDPPDGPLHVKVTADALFKNSNGQVMTASEFFAAITNGSLTVKVKGSYDTNLFTATRVEIKNN